MQDVHSLLNSLYRKGVDIWVENTQLRFKAPKGRLLPEERNLLRTRKSEIIRLLEQTDVAVDIPFDPRPTDSSVPLTPLQLGYWNSAQQGKKSKRECIDAVHAFGPLDTCLLRRSIEAVVQRHESLRTRIVLVDDAPVQQIDKTCEDYFRIVDVQTAGSSSVEKETQRVVEMFMSEEIDMSVGPLFAAMLLKLSTREFVLLLALDHVVADAASMGILSREVWTLYLQAVQGHSYSLPLLSVQFADYAIWEKRMYRASQKRLEAYWKGRLIGAPRIELPRDYRLEEAANPVTAMLHVPFGNAATATFVDMARREHTLLPLVILTTYIVSMSFWCNQKDLLIAFLTNGRHRPELENMVGYLSDYFYLRVAISDHDRFIDLLRRVTLEFYDAYDHLAFGHLMEIIPFESTPLAFNWPVPNWERLADDHPQQAQDNLRMQPFPLNMNWPVSLGVDFCNTTAAEIVLTVTYRTDHFAVSTIDRLGHLVRSCVTKFSECSLNSVASVSAEQDNSDFE